MPPLQCPSPAGLDIRPLPLLQDAAWILAVFGKCGPSASGVHVFHGVKPHPVIQTQGTRLFAVAVHPAQSSVVRGQGKGHAFKVVMTGHTVPQPFVIDTERPQAPAGIERRGLACFRCHGRQPARGCGHDLRQPLRPHMRYGIVAPPAFGMDLRRENGHRRVQPPSGVGRPDKRCPVLLRRAGNRHVSGVGQTAQEAQRQPESHADQKTYGHKFDAQPETFPKERGQTPRQGAQVSFCPRPTAGHSGLDARPHAYSPSATAMTKAVTIRARRNRAAQKARI